MATNNRVVSVGSRRPWSKAEADFAIECSKRGYSCPRISELLLEAGFTRTAGQIGGLIGRLNNGDQNPGRIGNMWSEEELGIVRKLAEEGYTAARIADALREAGYERTRGAVQGRVSEYRDRNADHLAPSAREQDEAYQAAFLNAHPTRRFSSEGKSDRAVPYRPRAEAPMSMAGCGLA